MTTSKKINYLKGHWAEVFCCFVLGLQGYQILKRRFKTPVGEVDVLALKKGLLVAIEVKKRASIAQAKESITPRCLNRLERAAAYYLMCQNKSAVAVRLDAFCIGRFFSWGHLRNIGLR